MFPNLRIFRMRRAPWSLFPPPLRGRVGRGHARLSAFHRGSDRWASRPAGATPGQVSWDAAGRPALYGRPNRGAQASRSSTGVTRARLSQSRESTSRTGRSAGQHDARSCPGADCIGPPAGTALAPLSGVPSAEGVLHRARFDGGICNLSRDKCQLFVTFQRTIMQTEAAISHKASNSVRYLFLVVLPKQLSIAGNQSCPSTSGSQLKTTSGSEFHSARGGTTLGAFSASARVPGGWDCAAGGVREVWAYRSGPVRCRCPPRSSNSAGHENSGPARQ